MADTNLQEGSAKDPVTDAALCADWEGPADLGWVHPRLITDCRAAQKATERDLIERRKHPRTEPEQIRDNYVDNYRAFDAGRVDEEPEE